MKQNQIFEPNSGRRHEGKWTKVRNYWGDLFVNFP